MLKPKATGWDICACLQPCPSRTDAIKERYPLPLSVYCTGKDTQRTGHIHTFFCGDTPPTHPPHQRLLLPMLHSKNKVSVRPTVARPRALKSLGRQPQRTLHALMTPSQTTHRLRPHWRCVARSSPTHKHHAPAYQPQQFQETLCPKDQPTE